MHSRLSRHDEDACTYSELWKADGRYTLLESYMLVRHEGFVIPLRK